MKKIIALLMAIALLFSLSACKKNSETLSDNGSDSTETATFSKPSDYATVLNIKINPEFELYLDDSNDVIAINAVNDDAKSFKDEIDLKDKGFENVIKEILKIANEKGFIKADAKINFKATANKAVANISDILSKASTAAKDITVTLNLNVTVNIVNDEEKDSSSDAVTSSKTTESSKPQTSSTVSSKPTTSSTVSSQPTSSKEESKNQTTQTESADGKPAESGPTVVNPKTNLNTEKEYISSIAREWDDKELYFGGIGFDSECAILLQVNYALEGVYNDIPPEAPFVTHKGKKYCRVGAGQSPYYFEITDTEIIVKSSFYEETEKINAKMVLLSDGTLKVTYVSEEEKNRFTVGEILK